MGKNVEFVGSKEIMLTMEINMKNRCITWYSEKKLLVEVEIPQQIQLPLRAFFSLKNTGDCCEFL